MSKLIVISYFKVIVLHFFNFKLTVLYVTKFLHILKSDCPVISSLCKVTVVHELKATAFYDFKLILFVTSKKLYFLKFRCTCTSLLLQSNGTFLIKQSTYASLLQGKF